MRELGIEDLRSAVLNGRVRITDRAEEGARSDGLTIEGVFESLLKGEVVESLPTQRPYPSWLVVGRGDDRPVHSVWSCNAKNGWAVLIRCTVAAPTQEENPESTQVKVNP